MPSTLELGCECGVSLNDGPYNWNRLTCSYAGHYPLERTYTCTFCHDSLPESFMEFISSNGTGICVKCNASPTFRRECAICQKKLNKTEGGFTSIRQQPNTYLCEACSNQENVHRVATEDHPRLRNYIRRPVTYKYCNCGVYTSHFWLGANNIPVCNHCFDSNYRVCDKCGKAVRSWSSLYNVHKGDKVYIICGECLLDILAETENGVAPIKTCPICNNYFVPINDDTTCYVCQSASIGNLASENDRLERIVGEEVSDTVANSVEGNIQRVYNPSQLRHTGETTNVSEQERRINNEVAWTINAEADENSPWFIPTSPPRETEDSERELRGRDLATDESRNSFIANLESLQAQPVSYDEDDYDGDTEDRDDIMPWDYKPNPQFYKLPEDRDRIFLGVELEVDKDPNTGVDKYSLANKLQNNPHIYCKHDGSLLDGFELVTEPCTLNYHENSLGWSELLELVKAANFTSNANGTCGLHVHVNRAQILSNALGRKVYTYCNNKICLDPLYRLTRVDNIKFAMFFSFYEGLCETFARRLKNNYAQIKKPKRYELAHVSTYSQHHDAVSFYPSQTVEFRLFGGTLDIEELLASLEFVHALVNTVKQNNLQAFVKGKGWHCLCNYVENNKKTYRYLKQNLISKHIWKGN